MSTSHPMAARAFEVIRLVGHVPEEFAISSEVSREPSGSPLGITVTRKGTGVRRVYELNGNGDWAFELETDLKGGYYGPS